MCDTGGGKLGQRTVFIAGTLAPKSISAAWTQPPANVAVLPNLSEATDQDRQSALLYRLIGNAVVKMISDAQKAVALDAVVSATSTSLSVPLQSVEDAIRFRIGHGVFTVEMKKSGRGKAAAILPFLSISAESETKERRRRYAASLASELEAQSDQIADIVSHKTTTGGYRETLLRRLLERHLPTRHHVATGFIYGCERQIDLLIYDRTDHPVFFREGDLVVVHPEAVRAVIEVKTTLDSSALCEALDLMNDIGDLRLDGPPVFKAIFGFKGATEKTVADYLRRFYRGTVDAAGKDSSNLPIEEQRIQGLGDPVNVVCIRGKSLTEVGFEPSPTGVCCRPVVREVRNSLARSTQVAEFLERLLAHLREPVLSTRSAPWLYPLIKDEQAFATTQPIEENDDWGPYAGGGDASEFERRLWAYDSWRQGEAWPS